MSKSYQIESEALIVQISEKGAEVKSIFSKAWGKEVLWSGDEKNWNGSAPLLFPIVGKLTDNEYNLKGKKFTMGQHGFARDYDFKCLSNSKNELVFHLGASQETFKSYPFCFELKVTYQLIGNSLKTVILVINDDRQDLLFSIGAHPGFLTENIEDYEIRFEADEFEYFRLQGGQVNWNKGFNISDKKIEVKPQLFIEDALILKNLKSNYIDLVNTKLLETIRVRAKVPYWGIWGKNDVPFVCIEPWNGIADVTGHGKNFEKKEGVVVLQPGKVFDFFYEVEIFNN